MENSQVISRRSLTTPTIDFLLLGGASLYLWAAMIVVSFFYPENMNHHFYYLAIMFSWLSIVCNYPHFIISYRFGYGRGKEFVFKNWPALIAVPAFLFIIYFIGYLFFHAEIKSYAATIWINSLFNSLGMNFQFGALPNLGIELLSLSVHIMYITTGWHYAKQAFGCIMVFSHNQQYPLTKFQRNLWKLSLITLAFYNFFYIADLNATKSGAVTYLFNLPVTNVFFPDYIATLLLYLVFLLGCAVIYFILIKNYLQFKKIPSSSILIPWIALHFWWIPFFGRNDFYFLAVPFFHSLQYLLFAYQLEAPALDVPKKKRLIILVLKTTALFAVGFLAFEMIPRYLDLYLSTTARFNVVFFLVAFSVFLNVHHFFIDSVVWRFSDKRVREKLLN